MGEKFNLTWHTFSSHGQELFKNLLETQEFSDVTLFSDDHHQYRVHKFILSACSSAFRKILTSNPLNSSIYLRGIHHEELESILQFIYLGKATIYHERMNEFLNVAKNFDIKEISENVQIIFNHTLSPYMRALNILVSNVIIRQQHQVVSVGTLSPSMKELNILVSNVSSRQQIPVIFSNILELNIYVLSILVSIVITRQQDQIILNGT